MAKLMLVAVLLISVGAAVAAAPAEILKPLSEGAEGFVGQEFEEPEEHLRFRWVTCDLLSAFGDAACAANCLSLGKAGGTCQNGICVCRQDKIKDLIDKRWPTTYPYD